jgi:hypothetical protein
MSLRSEPSTVDTVPPRAWCDGDHAILVGWTGLPHLPGCVVSMSGCVVSPAATPEEGVGLSRVDGWDRLPAQQLPMAANGLVLQVAQGGSVDFGMAHDGADPAQSRLLEPVHHSRQVA